MSNIKWTRRQFSQVFAASMAGAAIARPVAALTSARVGGLAVIGSMPAGGDGALHVFRVRGDVWQLTSTLPAAAPAHLVQHPTLPVLYAVHNVGEWNHLPRGAVSAYRIDERDGTLVHLHTQPLSLSATHPRHAVLTANASHLFVTAEGGGIYNLLPIAPNGSLLPVSGIRKEFGAGERTASPRQAALHPDGSMLTIDAGQQSLTRFHLGEGSLTVEQRARTHAGHGPSQLALPAGGTHAYTLHSETGEIAIHSLHPAGQLAAADSCFDAPGSRSLLAYGSLLFAAADDALTIFRMDPHTGALAARTRQNSMGSKLAVAASARHLLGLDAANGAVHWARFDPESGTVHEAAAVAHVDSCVSAMLLDEAWLPGKRVTA